MLAVQEVAGSGPTAASRRLCDTVRLHRTEPVVGLKFGLRRLPLAISTNTELDTQ
jgi:hypothetical protein